MNGSFGLTVKRTKKQYAISYNQTDEYILLHIRETGDMVGKMVFIPYTGDDPRTEAENQARMILGCVLPSEVL